MSLKRHTRVGALGLLGHDHFVLLELPFHRCTFVRLGNEGPGETLDRFFLFHEQKVGASRRGERSFDAALGGVAQSGRRIGAGSGLGGVVVLQRSGRDRS